MGGSQSHQTLHNADKIEVTHLRCVPIDLPASASHSKHRTRPSELRVCVSLVAHAIPWIRVTRQLQTPECDNDVVKVMMW